MNLELLVLDPPRGRDSWCWPKGSWPQVTKMEINQGCTRDTCFSHVFRFCLFVCLFEVGK